MEDGVEIDSDSGYHECPTDEDSNKHLNSIIGKAHLNASEKECYGDHSGKIA